MTARVTKRGLWLVAMGLVAAGCAGGERPGFEDSDLADPVGDDGGVVPPPAEDPGPGLTPAPDAGTPDSGPVSCAGTTVEAEIVPLPADIVWIVDNSSSMSDEIAAVRAGINAFADQLASSGIDYHLVMLSKRGTVTANSIFPICVPEPLAGPDCGDNARFLHANFAGQGIRSIQPLEQLLGSLAQTRGYTPTDERGGTPWRDHLRPEASKSIVVVSDENSRLSANAFLTTNGGTTAAVSGGSSNCDIPPGLKKPVWNGLFDRLAVHAMVGPNGATYRELATLTGGVVANIDEAGGASSPAWNTFFAAVASQVVSSAPVSCDLPIPAPPPGETLDPNRVNVSVSADGAPGGKRTLARVDGAADCQTGGWFYAAGSPPSEITLCPSSCAEMNASTASRGAEVTFGCATIVN